MSAATKLADEQILATLADPSLAGVSYGELARRLGMTTGSLRNRIARMRDKGHRVPASLYKGRPPAQPRGAVLNDPAERDRLVAEHIGLAEFFSRNHKKKFPRHEEDIQAVAALGLLRAAETFDSSLGVSFPTHACWKIRGALSTWVESDQHLIRVPKQWNYRPYRAKHPELTAQYKRLTACRGNGAAAEDDGADVMLSLVARVAEESEPDDRLPALAAALAELPGRWREVLVRRFGLGGDPAATLDEIGQAMGFTKERARQIEARAMVKIREAMGA